MSSNNFCKNVYDPFGLKLAQRVNGRVDKILLFLFQSGTKNLIDQSDDGRDNPLKMESLDWLLQMGKFNSLTIKRKYQCLFSFFNYNSHLCKCTILFSIIFMEEAGFCTWILQKVHCSEHCLEHFQKVSSPFILNFLR